MKTSAVFKKSNLVAAIDGIAGKLTLVALFLMSSLGAQAATDSWTGATDNLWLDSNWTGGNNPPVTGDSLVFGSTNTQGNATLYNNLNTTTVTSLGSITFSSGALTYTINGNALTLTGGIANSSSNTQTINDALVISSGGETFTGTTVVNGAVSGSGYINVGNGAAGSATLTLNGGGSQSVLNMNGGTLNVGAGGLSLTNGGGNALVGTGTITSINGGVLNINGGNAWVTNNSGQNLIINAVLSGSGGINTNNGGGTLTLGGANIASGNLILSTAETVKLTNSLALQNMTLAFNGSNAIVFDSSVASNTFILGSLSSNSNGSGNFALQNNAGTPAAVTIDVGNNNGSNSYSGVMSGAGTFNKWGSGTETLSGSNTYTGNTGVAMGQLKLDFSASNPSSNPAAPASNILYSGKTVATSGNLTLGGQSGAVGLISYGSVVSPEDLLLVQGKASTANTQTFHSTTLAYGYNGIQAIAGATGGSTTVSLGTINHQAGGAVIFLTPTAGGAITTTGAINTSTAADASGILGGYAIVTSSTSPTSSGTPNYATVDGSGNIIAYSGYTASGATINDSGAGTPTNIQLSATSVALGSTTTSGGVSTAIASGGAVNINTIYNTQSSSSTLTIGSGNVLRLGVNGGILANGSAGLTVSGGTLTAGGNTTGTAGEITILEPYQSQSVTINSVIANNNTSTGVANSTGGGAVTLTLVGNPSGGNDVVILGGNNTYSGGTYINDGRIKVNSTTGLGTGTVYVTPGGEAFLGASGTYANNFVVSGNGASENHGSIRPGNSGIILSGTITLVGDTAFSGVNGGLTTSGQITGNGNLTWEDGNTLILNNPSTTSSTMNNWNGGFTIAGGTVKEGAANQLANITGNVTINNGNTLELNGFNDTLNGLTSTGVGQGSVQNTTTATSSTLKVGNSGGTYTYAGAIRDGAGNGSGSGTLKIDKVGAGIFVIGNTTASGSTANDYTGGTQIDGGTLKLVASAPTNILGSASGTLTVNTGGTLDLNGNNLTVGALSGTGGAIQSSTTAGVTLTAGTSANSTYSGVLQNGNSTALNLVKQGTGTLDLAGANTYTGTTAINAGILELGFGGSLANMTGLSFGSSTSALALGDAGGATNLTLSAPITGSTATNSIVNGYAGGNSTVTLSTASTNTYVNAFGGAAANQNNLNVTIAGAGITTLSGTSTYTGATIVNGGSTFNLTGALGATAVNVSSAGVLQGSGNGTTSGLIGGTLAAAAGSTVKLTAGTSQLTVTGSTTLGAASGTFAGNYATLTYTLGAPNAVESLNTGALTANNVYINITNPTQTGTFTLANYASLTAGYDFSLSSTTGNVTTTNIGLDTLTLNIGSGTLTLTIVGAGTPGVAYFDGSVSNVWSTTNTSATPPTSWATNLAGTADAGNIPGSTTDVLLNANNATGTRTETLGTSTVINSLNVNGNGTITLGNPGDSTTLTINALADSNTASDGSYTGNTAGLGIKIGSASNPFTINVPLILGNSQQWTNASGNLFTVAGSVTGVNATASTLTLANTGAGGTTISGAIADGTGGTLALVVNNSGSGVTTLSSSTGNTYSGGTTLNDGTLTSNVSGGFGTGSVTVNPTSATSSPADNATLNTNGSIASTAAVTVNSETGDGGFGIGTINFNGSTPTVASLSGNGNVVLNNSTSTTLTVGNSSNFSSSFSGVISNGSGTGNLVKAGTGTLTLSGANTYNGTTTISAGVLKMGSATALPTNTLTGGSNLNIAGTLDLNGYNITLGSPATGAGSITNGSSSSSTSTLTIAGTGTLAETLTDSNSVSSGTGKLALTVSGGTLTVNNANTYSGGTTVNSGATVSFSNASGLGSGTVTDNGTVIINLNNATIANAFAGGGVINTNNLGVGATSTVLTGNLSGFTGTLNIGPGGGKLAYSNPAAGTQISSSATINILNGATFYLVSNVNIGSNFILYGGANPEGLGQLRFETTTSSGNGVLSGSITLAANTSIGGNNFASQNSTISGVINDGGLGYGFTKVGGETLVLSGANTYSGTTVISGGALNLQNTNALQNSTLNTAGLALSGGANQSLIFDSSVATHAFTFGGISGSGNVALADNASTPNAVALSIGNNNSSALTYSGVLSGIGSLNFIGTNSLTLTNSNTYSGTTTVTTGTLAIGNGTSGSINSTSSATVGASGTLAFDQANGSTFSAPINDNGAVIGNEGSGITNTLGGIITGSGAFSQNGLGTTVFSAANSYNGVTAVNQGTLQIAVTNGLSANSSVTVGNGTTNGTLAVGSFNTSVAGLTLLGGSVTGTGGTITSSNDYDLQSGLVSANLGGAVNAAIDGGGIVTLSGANTFTGTTTVSNNSIVNYQNGTAFGGFSAIIVNSGNTVQVQGNIAGGNQSLTLSGNGASGLGGTGALENVSGNNSYGGAITLASNSTIASDAGTLSLSGPISGAGKALTISGAGTVALGGVNTYSGITTINSTSTLALTGAGLLHSGSYAGNISNNGTFSYGSSAAQTLSGVISGSGVMTENGPGTLTLTGANTFTGAVNINSGTLSINSVAAGSNAQSLGEGTTVNLGVAGISSGKLLYTGGAGTLDKNINALGNGSDTITNNGSGVLTLSGTLTKNGTTLTLAGSNGFNITGHIVGTSANSDLDVTANTTLSNTNTYNGPTFVSNNATLIAAVTDALPNNATAVTLGSGTTSGTLQLGTGSTNVAETIASLTTSGTSSSNSVVGGNTGAASVLNINNSTADAYNGSVTGNIAINAIGSGALNLTGTVSTTGPLTVQNGSTLNGANSVLNVGSFAVGTSSAGTANVTVGNGVDATSTTTLIGAGASSFTDAKLTFNLNSAVAGQSNELLVGSTAITFANTTLTLNLLGSSIVSANTPYILIAGSSNSQYSGLGLSGNGIITNGLTYNFTDPTVAAFYANSYLFVNNGDIEIAVVPEPSTWAMMLGGLAMLLVWQRVRRSKDISV